MYDPCIGRWWGCDPLAAKYPFSSPYVFALNTPIWAMDPDGRIVIFANKKSEEQFNRLYNAADEETRAKLEILKNSDVVYNVNTQASLDGMKGVSEYNFSTSQFDVLIDKGTRNKGGALGDELTHAGQFESGEVGYVRLNDGQVVTLGYDMEDEVATKRAEILATNLIDTAEGTSIALDNTTQAFQKADTDPVPEGSTRQQMIENYFKTDPSAKQYKFDRNADKMGIHIPGSGGNSKERLDRAVNKGEFKEYIYREKQSDGTNETIRGNGN